MGLITSITNLTRAPTQLLGLFEGDLLHLSRAFAQAPASRGFVVALAFGTGADVDFGARTRYEKTDG